MAEESKSFRVGLAKAAEACRKATHACGFRVVSDNLPDGSLEAISGATILSWGESIVVTVAKDGDKARVTCHSRPTGQLFDWGKSEGNVVTFFLALEDELG